MTNRASVPPTQTPPTHTPATHTPAIPASLTDLAATVDHLGVAIKQLVRMLSNVRDSNAPATKPVDRHRCGRARRRQPRSVHRDGARRPVPRWFDRRDRGAQRSGDRDSRRAGHQPVGRAHRGARRRVHRGDQFARRRPAGAVARSPARPASTLAGLSLGESIVHGLDIARATDQAWPVRTLWARTVIDAGLYVLPHYLKPDRVADRRMRFEVRLRGADPLIAHLHIADGQLTVAERSAGRDEVDCYVSADPWTFVRVMYGRSGLGAPLAAGKIVAWGRRPWLGLRLPGYFRAP